MTSKNNNYNGIQNKKKNTGINVKNIQGKYKD